jgi:hypothetical protein
MGFTCLNEIEIACGSEEERRRTADLVLAFDSVDEDSSSREERGQIIVLRFESVDDLPEDELALLAAQFPDLSFTLVYFSLDGEFFGYAKTGASGTAADSEDFAEDTRDIVGRRYDGDGIAFVRARYSFARPGA